MDFRTDPVVREALRNRLDREKAKVFLSDGAAYGSGGEGFVRLNIGCPRSILTAALGQIRDAFQSV